MERDDTPASSYSSSTRVLLYSSCIIFIVICGVCFHYLEAPAEKVIRDEYADQLLQFLKNNTCIDELELKHLIKLVLSTREKTFAEFAASNISYSRWDIFSSVFFCASIVTTVGYGITPPATAEGRVCAVVCALVGIPVFMLCVAQAGFKLNAYFSIVAVKTIKRIANPTVQRCIRPAITIIFGVTMFLLLPAELFWHIEEWSYGEALYYCLVTILTIDFGDFVPSLSRYKEDYSPWEKSIYLLFVCFWMVFGLIWMAMIISSIQGLVCHTSEKLDFKLDILLSDLLKTTQDGTADQEGSDRSSELKTDAPSMQGSVRLRRASSVIQPFRKEMMENLNQDLAQEISKLV